MCHTDSQCYINSLTIYRLIHVNGSATTAKKAVITHFCCFQAAGWVVFEGCQFSFDAAASVDNSMSDDGNPCLSCGACYAFFRVSFYWAEADDGAGRVPAALTEPLTPFLRCMSGTNDSRSALSRATGSRRRARQLCHLRLPSFTLPGISDERRGRPGKRRLRSRPGAFWPAAAAAVDDAGDCRAALALE